MKNIYFKLLLPYFFVLILALFISFLSFFFISKIEVEKEISENLKKITYSLKDSILILLEKPSEEIQKEIEAKGKELGLRITLINFDGTVLADSHHNPKTMENHKLREEVQAALLGKPEVFKRYSNTVKETMYYYAIKLENKIILRVSFFTKIFSNIFHKTNKYLLLIFLSVIFLGALLSYLYSLSISNNLFKIHKFLKNLSLGEFKERMLIKKPEEFKEISKLLNITAEKLEEIFEREKSEKEEIAAILENINEPIAIIKSDGKVSYANNSFLKIFLKENFSSLYYFEIFNNLKILEILEKHLKEKKDLKEEIKIDNRFFIITLKYIPELSESLIILYDITYFKEILRIKKELVSSISHEIKTPLTVIYGYLEILEENIDKENLEMVKKVQEQIEKLKLLTEEMLRLSEIEEGKIREKFEKLNILEPLKNSIDLYKNLFEKKGLFIKLESQEKIFEILGSKKLFERLFLNLLDNSLKFTEKGGLFIRLKKKENFLEIEFEDTGVGIKEEDIPYIFERFYVSEKGRTKEKSGFGLGLSIVKHVVELHKGKIEVKSNFGKGTIFIINLPI